MRGLLAPRRFVSSRYPLFITPARAFSKTHPRLIAARGLLATRHFVFSRNHIHHAGSRIFENSPPPKSRAGAPCDAPFCVFSKPYSSRRLAHFRKLTPAYRGPATQEVASLINGIIRRLSMQARYHASSSKQLRPPVQKLHDPRRR